MVEPTDRQATSEVKRGDTSIRAGAPIGSHIPSQVASPSMSGYFSMAGYGYDGSPTVGASVGPYRRVIRTARTQTGLPVPGGSAGVPIY